MTRTTISVWVAAARPKTLGGAVAPVILALAASYCDACGSLRVLPAVLCALFAILMQIDANFINDYFDCLKGRDDGERLGPLRVCAQGLVSLPAMRRAITVVSVLCLVCGLPLICWGGWWMLAVAAACLLAAFAYTTHLAQRAMGDIMVLLYFGIIPVCITYLLQTGQFSDTRILLAGIGMGLATDCLLVINNFRDHDNDKAHDKLTLIVLIGRTAGLVLYLLLGVAAVALVVPLTPYWPLLAVYLAAHLAAWLKMRRIAKGRELNKVLGITGFNICLYAIFTAVAMVLNFKL